MYVTKTIQLTCSILAGVFLLSSCTWKGPSNIESAYANLPENIDFNYHVKPILSDKCFACHGPDESKRKAETRLDIAGSPAIKSRNARASLLVERIFASDAEEIMPPSDSKLVLSNVEKATLMKWIQQGGIYKPHWSFIAPEQAKLPSINSEKWCANEIDYFIAEKLENLSIVPNKIADKETLIRRLYFTLTGLPPTIKQIEKFVNDNSPDAYENLIDFLLMQEEYGERMAADWMDVARYADSDGYLDDKHRDFSPYRDWVIDALNHNMSYEDFVTHQLAGDLIREADKRSTLATAFNRLNKRNSEAGIVFEEYRQEYVADRTATIGKAFLGLTVECARCHDHKYDAISQKNYYEMAAFFNNTKEIGTAVYGPGQVPGPALLLTSTKQDEILDFINSKILESEQKMQKTLQVYKRKTIASQDIRILRDSLDKYLDAHYGFEKLTKKKNYKVNEDQSKKQRPAKVKDGKITSKEGEPGLFLSDYTTVEFPDSLAWFDLTDPFTISINIFPNQVYDECGILYHCEDFRLGLNGYSLHLENNRPKFIMSQSWPTNAIEVLLEKPLPQQIWSTITITYDGLGKANGINFFIDGEKSPQVTRIDNLYKSILFEPNIHTYGFDGLQLGVRGHMKTFLNGGLKNLKIYAKELSPLEVKLDFDPKLQEVLGEDIKQHFLMNAPDLVANKEELRFLLSDKIALLDSVPEIMVMGDMENKRPTYLLERGMYDAPTEQVYPDVPSAVLPMDANYPKNRLGLSMWLFDKKNPLTARVFVNRIWQMHFGRGLVASSDDFGNQGDLPTHPELLDWLAIQFMESGWDIKAMHKFILMSSTYKQSSVVKIESLEIDPGNELLARGPKMRMTAEMIRDNALAISGLLAKQKKGKSVYPYQPEGLWDEISNKSWRYPYLQESGDGLYRRSLYTIWKRTSPPPSMLIFDIADRGVCTVKRRTTSTPLQALVLLNDPQFIEASLVLSNKLILQEKLVNKRLEQAFHVATGRKALNAELKLLDQFYKHQEVIFRQDKNKTSAYISNGNTSYASIKDSTELAALAKVINGIMNTSDAITLR